jgi:hypothetical protein
MRRILVLLAVLLLVALPTLAQDQDLETLELPDGYSIDFPEGGDFSVDDGVISISNDEIFVDIFMPEALEDYITLPSDDEPADVLSAILAEQVGLDDVEINEVEIGKDTYVAWFWIIEDDNLKGTSYLLPLDEEGMYIMVDVYADSDLYDKSIALLDEIAVSVQLTDKTTDTTSDGPVECFVSTQDEDMVQLRVGPGENRSVIAFLPAGEDFTVTGSFTDNDDGLWYQLDKAEVDPDSPAAELWVSADAVDATEDCEAVAAVGAPPIIPSGNRPPTTGGTSGGGNTGGTNTTGGSIVNGLWSLYYSPSGDASCSGGQNVQIVTSEFLGYTVQANVLSVQGGVIYSTAEMNDGGTSEAQFTVTAPGTYTISYTYGGGVNSQVYLTVVNSRSMVGQEIFNFTIDGVACSGTIGVSASPS